jgi:hypothetical protein
VPDEGGEGKRAVEVRGVGDGNKQQANETPHRGLRRRRRKN